MKRRNLSIVLGVFLACGLIAAAALYLSRPRSAADQLERARRVEARHGAEAGVLRASGNPAEQARSEELIGRILTGYAEVGARYPGSDEAHEADYRILQIRDEHATGAETRLSLVRGFLKQHPESPCLADLKWRETEILHKDLKCFIEAVKAYEGFAGAFPKDERAPEALFRVGGIYEEIREFAAAARAYERVVKEYPNSRYADEAQFRNGNLLAGKLEMKQEAAKAFEKLEKEYPQSRFAAAAGSEKRKLASAAAKSGEEKYRDDYYGGVKEVRAFDRIASELNSPLMRRLRAQKVDLLHEDVRVELLPSDQRLSATVSVTVAALERTTSTLILQLAAPLKVRSILRGDTPAMFDHQEGFLFVDLGAKDIARDARETFTLTYSGANRDNWGGDIITSASTYLLGQKWVPILNLGDAFTADIEVIVPEGYTAITQGQPSGRRALGGATVFSFRQETPVFYYAVVAAPYKSRSAVYKPASGDSPGIDLSVNIFEDTPDAYFDGYLKEIRGVLEFLESKVGRYPYPKFAVAQVRHFPGGIGSPGLVLLGDNGFETTGTPATFLAHEMAHTWFGNELGLDLSDDSIPWLSEGFATYWDSLYHEHREGRQAFVRHMRTVAELYYRAASLVTDKPIRGTLMGDPIYGPLAYNKGAFVLHALRGLLGDEKFFAMTRKYVEENRQRVVGLADFIRACESAHGAPLDWFFDQWLDRTGIPRFRVNRAYQLPADGSGTFRTEIEIEQVGIPYRTSMDVAVDTRGCVERLRLDVVDSITTTTLSTRSEPVRVVLDPDYWILKHPRSEECEKPVSADPHSAPGSPQ
jgi:outer membrane protein assembly factor BamD (BamD/ComL family)